MKKLLFAILSIGLLIWLHGCIEDPAMTSDVIGAKEPEFDGAFEITGITASTITVKATVSKANGDEVTERGFLYSLSNMPSFDNGSDQIIDSGTGTGEYSLTIEGLTNNKRYYIRPYAINTKGAGYGVQRDTITNEGIFKVITVTPDSVFASSARVRGSIDAEGEGEIQAMGIYLCKKENINDVDTIYSDVSDPMETKAGMTFSCKLTGLTPSTWYYVQAFITNTYGTTTGDRDSLQTQDGKPFVGETRIMEAGYTDVTIESSVTNKGDETVTIIERGFCWAIDSVTEVPTLLNSVVSCGNGTGAFEGKITGLKSETRYYARAYATSNFSYTVYGEPILILTLIDVPTVSTNAITSIHIQNGNVDVGGSIDAPGMSPVIASGICWSTTNNDPRIEKDMVLPLTAGPGNVFSGRLSQLRGGTTYYVRAYATNNQGTGYGVVRQFTTPAIFTDGLKQFRGDARLANSIAYFSIGNYLYIFGGDIGATYTDELWRYSIAIDDWEQRRSFIDSPAKWQTSITYGQGALVYGGYNGYGDEKPGIYHYKSPENEWSYYEGPSDSAIVNRTVGYSDNSSSVFFIGGISPDSVREDVWSFDFVYNTWQKKTDFPVKQYGGIAVMIDNVAYAGMGRDAGNVCNGSIWTTDDGASTWNFQTSYAVTGNVLGGVVCNRRLYIVDESYYLIEYNPETDEWTQKSEIPDSHREFHCIYAVSNKIYIGLGKNDVKSIIIYDPVWDN